MRYIMKYLRWVERVVRITVRREWAIIGIRPQTMNPKICIRLSTSGVATTLLCVTEWSWPLKKKNLKEWLIKKFLVTQKHECMIFQWNLHYLLNKVEEIKILWSTEKGQIVQQQQKLDQNGIFRLHFHLSMWFLWFWFWGNATTMECISKIDENERQQETKRQSIRTINLYSFSCLVCLIYIYMVYVCNCCRKPVTCRHSIFFPFY